MELFSLYFYTFLQADLVEITPSDSGMSCQSRCLSLPSQSARQKTPHFMFICSCSNKAWKQMKDNCSLKISPFTCDVKGEVLTGGSGRLRVAASEEEETSTSSSHTSRSATEVPQLQRQKENRKVWRRFKKHSFSGQDAFKFNTFQVYVGSVLKIIWLYSGILRCYCDLRPLTKWSSSPHLPQLCGCPLPEQRCVSV